MAEKKEKKQEMKHQKAENAKPFIVGTRGRTFEGSVVKKFPRRAVLEYERTVFVKKYERFFKNESRIHARIPDNLDVKVGDYILVQECRPLSKIIHHVVIKKIRSAEDKK